MVTASEEPTARTTAQTNSRHLWPSAGRSRHQAPPDEQASARRPRPPLRRRGEPRLVARTRSTPAAALRASWPPVRSEQRSPCLPGPARLGFPGSGWGRVLRHLKAAMPPARGCQAELPHDRFGAAAQQSPTLPQNVPVSGLNMQCSAMHPRPHCHAHTPTLPPTLPCTRAHTATHTHPSTPIPPHRHRVSPVTANPLCTTQDLLLLQNKLFSLTWLLITTTISM